MQPSSEEKLNNLEQNLDEMLSVLESDSEESRKAWQSYAASLTSSRVSGEELQRKCKRFIPLLRKIIKIPLVRNFFSYVIELAIKYSWLKKL